ncbi:MAG: MucB/RseB C-terminal domain-containing protein, partial [Gammaproteobacteria bacterium]
SGPAMPARAAWRVGSLPPGFSLLDYRSQPAQADAVPMEQLVYSDGVVRVSVFIESGVAPAEQAGGASRMGATNAFTTVAGDYLVTAVGEVPLRTVETIAKSVSPAIGPGR